MIVPKKWSSQEQTETSETLDHGRNQRLSCTVEIYIQKQRYSEPWTMLPLPTLPKPLCRRSGIVA